MAGCHPRGTGGQPGGAVQALRGWRARTTAANRPTAIPDQPTARMVAACGVWLRSHASQSGWGGGPGSAGTRWYAFTLHEMRAPSSVVHGVEDSHQPALARTAEMPTATVSWAVRRRARPDMREPFIAAE